MIRTAKLFLLPVLLLACKSLQPAGEPEALLAYVANAGSNHVQVVDLESGETRRKIYSGVTPWRLVPSPDGRELWVQHWSSETTAVVALEDHEVRATLPLRGPGTFDHTGERFFTFTWPSSGLSVFDAKSYEQLETRAIQVSRVYDFALDESDENLFMVQYDPIAQGQSQRYAYLASYPLTVEQPTPTSVRTGQSPVQVLTVPGEPFVLTTDSESNSMTLLNINGDGRTVPACPAPKRLVLSEDKTRLVVLCWNRASGRHGHVVSLEVDFAARPWPEITEVAAVELDGGPVAGAFAPAGDRLWVVDQPGRRLLELDPDDLTVAREIPTGEVPTDVVLARVPESWRERLGEKGANRKLLEDTLVRLRSHSAPFTGLSWTEAISWDQPLPPEDGAPEGAELKTERRTRRLEMALAAPARLRRQSTEEAVSLSAGGWSATVRRDGRFWTTPRQEIASLLYALPNFEPEEAVRRLAGDVTGSPRLSGGLAVDLVTEVEEEGRRYVLVGALTPGREVAQLLVDAETGLPVSLVEKLSSAPAPGPVQGHDGVSMGRFVETRFHDFLTLEGGVALPSRLDRILDGQWRQEVLIEEAEVDPELAAADFDLARLGSFASPDLTSAAVGPGEVPVLAHAYLENPWTDHPPYPSNPPTSGPRLRALAEWGTHVLPVPPELLVHNLEHGGVALQYNCPEGCPELVAQLESVAEPYGSVMIAPYPFMKSRIALTAWGRVDTLDEFDEVRVAAFLEAWEGHDHHTSQEGE